MNCKLCGINTKKKYTLKGSRAESLIVVDFCKDCSAHFCQTINYDYENTNKDIIHYYEKSKKYIEWRQHKIFNFIKKNFCHKPGVFLDIGSGIGYSLKVAEELGWQAVGVEPGIILEEYSRTELKLKTINGYLSKDTIAIIQSELPFGYADYILVDNVLEHIPNPVEFLINAINLLKSEGVILIAIPPVDWLRRALASIPYIRQNSGSAQLNLFYDPEQHVNYFSRKAMQILVKKVGGCKLTSDRFHHSKLLNYWPSRTMQFETGYYFIVKNSSQ